MEGVNSSATSSLLLQGQKLKQFRSQEADQLLHQAEERLKAIQSQLKTLEVKDSALKGIDMVKEKQDWTKIYAKADTWEALETYQAKQQKEEENIESLLAKQEQLGHYHDHSKEREFFQLDEEVKLRKVEDQKIMGNYFHKEGHYQRACERYLIALGYCEYCFPPDSHSQRHLDELRCQCLCNLSLCQIRRRQYREAIESCSKVLIEEEQREREGEESQGYGKWKMKALYRRAQAYRLVGEYTKAKEDLEKAQTLAVGDSSGSSNASLREIKEERKRLQESEAEYAKAQEDFAKKVINIKSNNNNQDSTGTGEHDDRNEEKHAFDEKDLHPLFDHKRPLEPVKPACLLQYEMNMSKAVTASNRKW